MIQVINDKNIALWNKLFEEATAYVEQKPWEYFDDSYVFGVQDPNSGVMGWCVILGSAGVSLGLSVYLGDEGMDSLIQTTNQGFSGISDDEIIRNQKSILLDLGEPDNLDEVELEIHQKLGYQPREGLNNFLFRKMDPGFFPWYLDDQDVEFMTHCLNQALNVLKLDKQNQITVTDLDSDELVVMIPAKTDGGLQWTPGVAPIPEYYPENDYIPKVNYINTIRKKLKKKHAPLMLSTLFYPEPIQDGKGTRPFFPIIMIWIDGKNGLIIDFETVKPQHTWKSFQNSFQSALKSLGYIPTEIYVNSDKGYDLLDDLADRLRIEIIYEPDHEIFVKVAQSMGEHLKL